MDLEKVVAKAEAAITDYEKEVAEHADRKEMYQLAYLKTQLAIAMALTYIAKGNRDISI